MYASQYARFFGDKLTLYISKSHFILLFCLVIMALFIVPYKLEQREANKDKPKEPNPRMEKIKEKVKGFFKRIWANFPKYSDLQKKQN